MSLTCFVVFSGESSTSSGSIASYPSGAEVTLFTHEFPSFESTLKCIQQILDMWLLHKIYTHYMQTQNAWGENLTVKVETRGC